MKTELEEFINENIDAFYSRTPDPAVLERIRQQMFEADRKKKEKTPVISLRLRWAVAACLILLAGGVSYLALQKTEPQQTAVVTPAPTVTTPRESKKTTAPVINEVTAKEQSIETSVAVRHTPTNIEEEAYLQKTVLFAKLNNTKSPGERLTAASNIDAITSADNDIVDVLAKTMNTDPNTNVRLAALDALSKFYREPYVKKKLLASLQQQKDPMVQIALIELLTKMKEVSILKQLNKIVSDESTIQPVKDQAYSGILTLRS